MRLIDADRLKEKMATQKKIPFVPTEKGKKMNDELVKALRETDFSYGCPCGAETLCKDKDCVIIQAADAIEEQQAQIDGWIEQERLLRKIKEMEAWDETD